MAIVRADSNVQPTNWQLCICSASTDPQDEEGFVGGKKAVMGGDGLFLSYERFS